MWMNKTIEMIKNSDIDQFVCELKNSKIDYFSLSFVRQGTMFCIILLSRLISFVSNQMYTRVNAIQTKT